MSDEDPERRLRDEDTLRAELDGRPPIDLPSYYDEWQKRQARLFEAERLLFEAESRLAEARMENERFERAMLRLYRGYPTNS